MQLTHKKRPWCKQIDWSGWLYGGRDPDFYHSHFFFFLRNVEEGGVLAHSYQTKFFTIVLLPMKCWGWKKLIIPRHTKNTQNIHRSSYSWHCQTEKAFFTSPIVIVPCLYSKCFLLNIHTHKDNTVLELQ